MLSFGADARRCVVENGPFPAIPLAAFINAYIKAALSPALTSAPLASSCFSMYDPANTRTLQ